jgi:hypothetical protein
VTEVRIVRGGSPNDEQSTEYRVTTAEGGTDGNGEDQYMVMEVAVVFDVLTFRTFPGGTSVQSNLASSAWEHALRLLAFRYAQAVRFFSVP